MDILSSLIAGPSVLSSPTHGTLGKCLGNVNGAMSEDEEKDQHEEEEGNGCQPSEAGDVESGTTTSAAGPQGLVTI